MDGVDDGNTVGDNVGNVDGSADGVDVGCADGSAVGVDVGNVEGVDEGNADVGHVDVLVDGINDGDTGRVTAIQGTSSGPLTDLVSNLIKCAGILLSSTSLHIYFLWGL